MCHENIKKVTLPLIHIKNNSCDTGTDLTGHWPQATGQRDSIHLELREHSPSLAQVAQYLGREAHTQQSRKTTSNTSPLWSSSIFVSMLSESHDSDSIYVKFEEL